MLKLTVDPIVLQTLKKAMPKTDKADHALSRYVEILRQMMEGNPPDRPEAPEVEFSTKEFLYEEVKIYRQPDHGCAQTG